MATVTVHITTVQKPAPTNAFGKYRYILKSAEPGNQQIFDETDASTSHAFSGDVADGVYFVQVYDIDVFGNIIDGPVASNPFGVNRPDPNPNPAPYQGVNDVTVTVS